MKFGHSVLVATLLPLAALELSGCAAAPSRTNAFETLTPTSSFARK
jgi:hypothetical protein